MTFYSYIIMDNHFHVSGQAPNLTKFSRFFQRVHSLLAKEINKRNKRCGQVIRDRFKSPLIQNEDALCREMIYHDLNEVRCGKTNDPMNNELSSYAHYAYGKKDPLITEPDFYQTLGKTPKERQAAYRTLVLEILVAAPRKKNGQYTRSLFVGDPLWVEERYKELKELRKRIRMGEIEAGQDPPN
jgi:putative transposase